MSGCRIAAGQETASEDIIDQGRPGDFPIVRGNNHHPIQLTQSQGPVDLPLLDGVPAQTAGIQHGPELVAAFIVGLIQIGCLDVGHVIALDGGTRQQGKEDGYQDAKDQQERPAGQHLKLDPGHGDKIAHRRRLPRVMARIRAGGRGQADSATWLAVKDWSKMMAR